MIPQNIIEEVKEKTDIINIVSFYVPSLKKRGKNYIGLCPFHSEKTPSFTVSQEKGLFHCFGCNEGGNVFSFVMKVEKVDFVEAVKIIGEKVGILLDAKEQLLSKYKKDGLENFYSIMELACKFYENHLDEISGYIKERGIKSPEKFRLGYAPDNWDSLISYLTSHGANAEDIEKVGLVVSQKSGSGFYDRFRNRLIFPIMNQRNKVVGFGGRALNKEDEPKYLNTPESVIFSKGETLYNLGFAKEYIKKQKFAILVEGYMDVIACCEEGLLNVVAPLGTSLTSNQAKLLSRFSDIAVIAFDSDPAGQLASERAQEVLKDVGISVRITSFEGAKDPDEFIRKIGINGFVDTIKKACPAIEFKIRRIIGKLGTGGIENKVYAAHEIARILSFEKDKILREEYTKLAAKLLSISYETLAHDITAQNTYKFSSLNLRRKTEKPTSKIKEAEKCLIRLIVEWDEALLKIKDELSLNDFSEYRKIFEKLWETDGLKALDSLPEDNEGKILRGLILSEEPIHNKEKILTDCINTIKMWKIQDEMAGLRVAMLEAEKQEQNDRLEQMKKEYCHLNEIIRGMPR